jgi:hypothetical protein
MGVHAEGGGIPASGQPGYSATTVSHIGGWVVFAGTMLMVVSVLNIIYGIAAISNSSFFVNDAQFVFSDLNTWGWIVLGTGAVQMLVAFGVWARSSLATWAGIAFAGLNAIAQLLMIPAYPFLSLALFAVNMMVIYGLAVHGGHADERL